MLHCVLTRRDATRFQQQLSVTMCHIFDTSEDEKHNIHADSFKNKFLSLMLIYSVKHQKYVYFLLHIYLNRSLLKLNCQSTVSFCIGTIVVKFAGSPLWSLQLLNGVISCVRIPRDQIPFQIEVQTHAELHS